MNTGRKFLLSHNRFISIYDMSKRKWEENHPFPDLVRQIFRNRKMERRDKKTDDYMNFGVLHGPNSFSFFEMHNNGKIKKDEEFMFQVEGRVKNFKVDQLNDVGFFFTVEVT